SNNISILMNLSDPLIGYWEFEEGVGDTAYDSSGYGNDGNLMNGPTTWVNSLPLLGKALRFDGNDDYIRVADNETLSSPANTKAITFMAWVKPDSGLLDVYARVIASHWSDLSGSCSYGDPSNAWVIEAHRQDGKYYSGITDGTGSGVSLRSKTSAKEGVWQHVTFTWDGSLVTFYFNGIADTSVAYAGNMVNSFCYMQIGRTDQTDCVWKGLIDDVTLYNCALSPEEIRSEFENSFVRGDANVDGKRTVSDVVYLINYLFKGGSFPQPLLAGDANCDGQVTVSDVVFLINYLFKGGPTPNCS
ncbi:MAG TPA: LamG-like jellyroll fold domain-containing protein, partial [candidate division Zixibacteria bacterium]